MLTTRGLGVVLADLSTMGFDAKWGVVSAADVGANHQRERIWIRAETNVAHSKSCGSGRNTGKLQTKNEQQTTKRQEKRVWQSDYASQMVVPNVHGCVATEITASTQKTIRQQQAGAGNALNIAGTSGLSTTKSDVANSCGKGLQGSKQFQNDFRENITGKTIPYGSIAKRNNDGGTSVNWWDAEPNVGRVADGVAARVDRLKAIGNGQVPLCAATAWRILTER